jgi:hypothetical protein
MPLGSQTKGGITKRLLPLLAAALLVSMLVSFISACGAPKLSYVFVDGEQRDYMLRMSVAEKGGGGETLGTVTLEALLHAEVNMDKQHSCACFVTIDYGDAKISTTGSGQSSGNQIPRAYFHLYEDGLLTFTAPSPRDDGYSIELAKTGPNGSLSIMLLNTLVCKCFAQPLRDSRHDLQTGDEWMTTRQLPGEFMTYLYTGNRSTAGQNKETTLTKVTELTEERGLAELAWSSVTPLRGSRQIDMSESLLQSGMDPSELAALDPADLQPTVSMSGSSTSSGVAFVRMSDGWPERASVDRMTIDLTYAWSDQSGGTDQFSQEGAPLWPTTWRLIPSYPADLLASDEAEPVETILEITGSIEAVS